MRARWEDEVYGDREQQVPQKTNQLARGRFFDIDSGNKVAANEPSITDAPSAPSAPSAPYAYEYPPSNETRNSAYLERIRDTLAESLRPEMQERYKKRKADALAQQDANYQGPEAIQALADGDRMRALQSGLTKAANKFGSFMGDGGQKSDLPSTLDAFGQADKDLFQRRSQAYAQGVKAEDEADTALMALDDRQLKLAAMADAEERAAAERAMDDDPNSEVSKSYQAFLSELTGGKLNVAGVPASRLKPLMGPYEGVYRVREQSAAKKAAAESQRQAMEAAAAERAAAREDARRERAGARAESREQRLADQALAREQRLADEQRRLDEKDPSREQSDAVNYANRVDSAERVFQDLERNGYDRTTKGAAVGAALPGFMQSGDARSQEQAERNFLTAVLRRESGASISPSEFAEAEKVYFPRTGDTPEVIAEKKRNREGVLKSLRSAAGCPGARFLQNRSSSGGQGTSDAKIFQRGTIPEAD